MYKGNTEIPHQTSMHNTSTVPMCNASGLWQCTTMWPSNKIHKETTNSSKHMCQAYIGVLKVLQCNTSTHGPSLVPS